MAYQSSSEAIDQRDARLAQICSSLKLTRKTNERSKPLKSEDQLEATVGGIYPSRLIDCLNMTTGCGGGLLALSLCVKASKRLGETVVIDSCGTFYPPVAISWGIEAERLLIVQPRSNLEAIAATELALHSPAVSAVWSNVEYVEPKSYRRLLLAAEASQAFGVLVRSAKFQHQPCWADVQLLCEPLCTADEQKDSRFLRVTQIRNRHGPAEGETIVSMNWRSGEIRAGIVTHESKESASPMSLVPRLASAELSSKAS